MFWDMVNNLLEKINNKLDAYNEKSEKRLDKLERFVDHMEKGYRSDDYDNDYKNIVAFLSNMSIEELEKEKFLVQSVLQTKRKDEGYNGISLIVSAFVLVSTIFINYVNSWLSNMDISVEKKWDMLILLTIGVVSILLIFVFAIIIDFKKGIKYNKEKQQYRLKLKIINKILEERKLHNKE